MENIIDLAKKEFYWLHQHPELSGQEYKTTARLKDFLERHGIIVEDLALSTGLVAEVKGLQEGPTIAIRCDIDALPVQEQTELEYKSIYPGCMHACGHDFHAATLLGIALALQKQPPLRGKVKLVFQPAEENLNGAQQIIASGALTDVDAIFGLHCSAAYPVGTIICSAGAMHGAVDNFHIAFNGVGAHACRPQQAVEPILMLSNYIMTIQGLVSRGKQPFNPAVLSITHVQAGSCNNIIPDSGFLEGTLRTVYKEDRVSIKQRMEGWAQQIAAGYGGSAEITWDQGLPATNNQAVWVDLAKAVAQKLGLPMVPAPNSLAGEDFAFYQEKLSGAFIQIGTGVGPMQHNPCFAVNPQTFAASIPFGYELALAALAQLEQQGGVGND